MPGRTAMMGVGPSWPANCDERKGWTERIRIGTSTHLFEMVHEMVKVCCSEQLQVKWSMHSVVGRLSRLAPRFQITCLFSLR